MSDNSMSYAEAAASGPTQSSEEVSFTPPPLLSCKAHGRRKLTTIIGVCPHLSTIVTRVPSNSIHSRANPVPEIIPTDQSIDSLIDVDTSGIPVVPNDFLEQDVRFSPAPSTISTLTPHRSRPRPKPHV